MTAVFAQAFGEAGIVEIAEPALWSDQGVETHLQVAGTLEEGERIQAGFLGFERQSLLQDGNAVAWPESRSSLRA